MSVITTLTTSAGAKHKVDERVKHVIEEAVSKHHRALFLVVGDRAKDQIVNIHTIASRANHNAKLNLLWCMKTEPDFGTTSKKKLKKQGNMEIRGGVATEESREVFHTFLQQNQIRFCHYKDSHKILGNTFGMAVLQDFEAITPNILARTIETVQGGGVIVLMLRAMRSFKQLYTIAMDVHSRYRSEQHRSVVPRFNERFLLSLADCPSVLCVDDDLNVLPFTTNMREMLSSSKRRQQSGNNAEQEEVARIEGRRVHEAELATVKQRLKTSGDVGPLVNMAQTIDQAKVILALMQAVTEKSLSATCAVTAARGRGKSTALGIAVAGAVSQGYSNIFVTSPSPENLNTFFEFVVKALVEMGYRERIDFDIMQSTNPELSKCVIRVNIFKTHRQTVQFVSATDTDLFVQAELIVIDEAAAIPLPLVQRIMGPCLIFISSTVSGYEGTGRSLSMKLIADMRKNSGSGDGSGSGGGRTLRELQLSDPIRYGPDDSIEQWLNKLLCLEATNAKIPVKSSPHPSKCELHYVNRDALFSYHPKAEQMLHRVVALFVSAHYKNQPNDLQLMSDAPGHHIFALCSPFDPNAQELPDVFCVIHVCEEGKIAEENMNSNLSKGIRPSGDLIPYTLSQYYLNNDFSKLAGVRIVRIATNPDFQRGGYGTRALQLLLDYYKGNISIESANYTNNNDNTDADGDGSESIGSIGGAVIRPRSKIPVLLQALHERPYEVVDYVGTSFGITTQLFNFWKKSGFEPVYVRQSPNDLTGEHSCVLVNVFDDATESDNTAAAAGGFDVKLLRREFLRRFTNLLSYSFRRMPFELSLSIIMDAPVHSPQKLAEHVRIDSETKRCVVNGVPQASFGQIVGGSSANDGAVFTPSDFKRLKMYASSFVDMSVVLDLVQPLAKLYFSGKIFCGPGGEEGAVLSHSQAAVLLAVGLQSVPFEALTRFSVFASVQLSQLKAFLNKAINRLVDHLNVLERLARSSAAAVAKGGDEDEEQEEEGDEETFHTDAQGNVVSLSVKRKVTQQVDMDQTLFRDARMTSASTRPMKRDGGSGGGGKPSKQRKRK